MSLSYRKAAVAVLAGALLCGTAACTGEKDSPAPAAGASRPAQKPVEVTPAAAVEKAAENTRNITSFTYRMSGKVQGQTVDGTAAMSLKPPAMQMHMKGGSAGETGEVEIRLTGDAMYINGGAEAAAEMDGKTWLKLDMAELKKSTGQDPLGGLSAQADRNPAADSLSMSASKDLKKVGTATIDGVQTTHYIGTVPLEAMRASLADEDAATRERREEELKRYEDLGVEKLSMDMWIDGSDRTKQVRTRAVTDEDPLDLTITFLDFDKPLTVKAPPASETMDLAEMMEGVGAADAA
ncbi:MULTISPECIES: DUF1396 domain-containing protein [unclassified Streptomyces]|uniref:DUF1396 domain-containing protein n=1 Tax=unclassified Streptomyces TaxID=2593676 RepID=UPI0036E0FBED